MGLAGISKSTVSKLCKEIDERVTSFLERPLEGEWPYLWLGPTYLKVSKGGSIGCAARMCRLPPSSLWRSIPMAGARSWAFLGPSEAEPFWSSFLKGLLKRGLPSTGSCWSILRMTNRSSPDERWRQAGDRRCP